MKNFNIAVYMKEYVMESKTLLMQGMVSILGVSMSFLESIEIYARISGAVIGITVGVFTIYRLFLDIKIKRKQLKDSDATGD